MASKKSAGRIKVAFAFLLLFGPAFILIFISTRSCEHKFKELPDYGAAIQYSITDVNGKKWKAKDFKDQVVLVTTLQPKCPGDCAVPVFQLDHQIYQIIRKAKGNTVRMISFVTDGKGNPATAEDVKTVSDMLAADVEGYDPEIWIVGTGDARALYDFKNNDIELAKKGDEFYGGEAFQEILLLLDKENHLRMTLSGKTEGMVRRMKEHVALLQKQYDKAAADEKK